MEGGTHSTTHTKHSKMGGKRVKLKPKRRHNEN